MGIFINTLFEALLSWVRALVSSIWALFTSDRTTALEFFGKNWVLIALVIIVFGLVVDWLVWLIRWQPYHIWAIRAKRLLGIDVPEEDAVKTPAKKQKQKAQPESEAQPEESWFPPAVPEEERQQVYARAESAPDEMAYPGMRYDAVVSGTAARPETQRFSAFTQEGPGAAETQRRRAEIEAWQQQMQDEARQKAERELAERRAREAEQARLAQQKYEAEQARLAQQQYEAEQARLAQQQYEAEQARLAQAEYQRQLAEYEQKKAQYERELAEYERQKAAYDAQMAGMTPQSAARQPAGAPDDLSMTRRRRALTENDISRNSHEG